MSYEKMFSPIQVGNKTLKSRLLHAKSSMKPDKLDEHFEEFYLQVARAGAAIVTVWPGDYYGRELVPGASAPPGFREVDMLDPAVRAAYRKLTDDLHALGSLATVSLMCIEPMDYAISDTPNWEEITFHGDYNPMCNRDRPGISHELLEKTIEELVWRAADLHSLGFDCVTFYMSYRASLMAASLSPVLNQRTDEYGGKTNAERARLTTEIFRRLKERCPDILIEAQLSGEEEAPGYTVEDLCEYAKLWGDLVDIYQVRGYDGSETHVCGYNMKEHQPNNLRFAARMKAAGVPGLVSPIGGFGNPDDIERALEAGECDLVSMARQYIADPDYAEKLQGGRREDVTPCLLCNGCHDRHKCAVNPTSADKGPYPAPARSKYVAVIGGGPAGLQAALTAARRGHKVDLFEQSDRLGGQLVFADYPDFKWPLRNYRDWLIAQTAKAPGVEIYLGTKAVPEAIKNAGYDAIICAVGSRAVTVPVPGADAPGLWMADQVFGREAELGHRVVIVGGGMTGREAALYLAKAGHDTTMLTRGQANLFYDSHATVAESDACLNEPNFHYIEHCDTLSIRPDAVEVSVKLGVPHTMSPYENPPAPGWVDPLKDFDWDSVQKEQRTLACDSVVISGGRKSLAEEAQAFAGCAPEVYVIGDAEAPGAVRKCTSQAYAAAMKL